MNKLKNEKGITMISLVVTLVIMAIIASITITVSNLDNGMIDETKEATKKAQINKYKELIEITRQEALSREYILEINGSTVLEEMCRIMSEENYADEAYKNARDIDNNFSISGIGENAYIQFETVEGYIFEIYKDRTE